MVVHGSGGLDEASLAGPNQFRFLDKDIIRSESINPSDLGLTEVSNESLKGDDLNTNSQILMSLLKGEGNMHHKEVVALNTALVLWVSGAEDDMMLAITEVLTDTEIIPDVGKYYTFIYSPKTPRIRYDQFPFISLFVFF